MKLLYTCMKIDTDLTLRQVAVARITDSRTAGRNESSALRHRSNYNRKNQSAGRFLQYPLSSDLIHIREGEVVANAV